MEGERRRRNGRGDCALRGDGSGQARGRRRESGRRRDRPGLSVERSDPVKIMVINPNSSDTVTGAIMDSARRAASPGTELVPVTTKGGTRNIDSAFADYLSGADMIRTCLDEAAIHRPDAIVLAGFGRVGIDALKEALTIPVVSIAEASMAMACLLGHRFTTLTMLQQFIPYQQDLVRYYGFEAKCASVRAININVEECVTDRDRTLRELTT